MVAISECKSLCRVSGSVRGRMKGILKKKIADERRRIQKKMAAGKNFGDDIYYH